MNKPDVNKTTEDTPVKDLPAQVDFNKSETTKPADPDTGKARPQVVEGEPKVTTTENAVSDNSVEPPKHEVNKKGIIRDYESGALNYDQLAQKHGVEVSVVSAILESHSEKKAAKADKK